MEAESVRRRGKNDVNYGSSMCLAGQISSRSDWPRRRLRRMATRDFYARFRFAIGFAQLEIALADYSCRKATTARKLT
jgi:hypothetical protein